MAGLDLSTNTRFGIFYVITRLALAILVLIHLVVLIINIFQCSHCSVGTIIWFIFAILILLVGLLAAFREHFLTALVFAIVEIILAITGFIGGVYLSSVATLLCLICAITFSVMLYMSGSRDMNVPQIC